MTEMLGKLAETWADRWRYPELVAALSRGLQITTATDLARSVLAGLATPTTTCDEAIRNLADAGEYKAAQTILDDNELVLDISDETNDYLDRSRRDTQRHLERRRAILAERARRAGADVVDTTEITHRLERSRREATTRLDEWEKTIYAQEQGRAADLERRLIAAGGADHPAWAAAVRAGIDAKQFPAAERRIEAGPDDDSADGPLAIPRGRERFPWTHLPIGEIFDWYLDPNAEPRPEFLTHWQPEPDDAAARQVVTSLQALADQLDRSTVRAFAEAVDGLIGADGARHPVTEHGAGMLTELSGLHDHRLMRLGLPDAIPLWVGKANTPPPEDTPIPTVWLRLDLNEPPDPPSGVVVLTPQRLFELLAPGADRQTRSSSTRRINLLRILCLQLPVHEILNADRSRIGLASHHELYDDLAWLLDLLGVHAEGGVVDALSYYTGGHPVALRAALDALLAGGRPTTLAAEDLSAWRLNTQAIAAFREAVFSYLDSDPEIGAVSYAALWHQHGADPAMQLAERDIADMLAEPSDDYEYDDHQDGPMQDLGHVLQRATTAGLLWTSATGYALRAPGLVELLGVEEVTARLEQALEHLSQRRQTVLEQVSHETLVSSLHVMKVKLYGLRAMAEDLTEATEINRQDLNPLARHARELEELAAVLVSDRIKQLLMPKRIELGALLVDIQRRYAEENSETIGLGVYTSDDSFPTNASKHLLTLAIENLVINAVQAIHNGQGTGQIHIHMRRRSDDGPGETVVSAIIDIEDSGPGLDPDVIPGIKAGLPISSSPSGTGKGLPNAKAHIEYSGGTFTYVGRSAKLGGAHFQIQLPLVGAG